MTGFLRAVRMGDGSLARFNGMGRTVTAALATVLTYDEDAAAQPPPLPHSRYQRLSAGPMILVMDVGPPPPLALAGEAHAGTLSFELSIGNTPVIINCGAPGPGHEHVRPAARATASHSTLSLADRSSAQLVRSRTLERWIGTTPLTLPGHVSARFGIDAVGMYVSGMHEGYVREHGLAHTRLVHMRADGQRLAGEDRLGPRRGTLRIRRDKPFAIRFHLASEVECRAGPHPGSAVIDVPGQGRWLFSAEGVTLSIEQSLDYSFYSGPRHCQQIVLRGACPGETMVRWQLEPLASRPPPLPGA